MIKRGVGSFFSPNESSCLPVDLTFIFGMVMMIKVVMAVLSFHISSTIGLLGVVKCDFPHGHGNSLHRMCIIMEGLLLIQ